MRTERLLDNENGCERLFYAQQKIKKVIIKMICSYLLVIKMNNGMIANSYKK